MKRIVYKSLRNYDEIDGLVIGPRRLSTPKRKSFCAIEDIAKTDTWLTLNSVVGRGTPVTFVNVSHYKVESDKARRLAWIAETSTNVRLIDVTPFYGTIENLYLPLRYVDRGILGYQHHYAFAGGHAEVIDGRIVPSHDYELNARKLSPHCELTGNPIRRATLVVCQYNESELAAYQSRRDDLFRTKKTPQPIITALSDLMHGCETRVTAVAECTPRDGVIVVNIDAYADMYRKKGFRAGTYAKPPCVRDASCIVFAEPPIVYTYRRIHIEGAAGDGCTIVDVTGNSKIDAFLYSRIATERDNISRFCEQLCESIKQTTC